MSLCQMRKITGCACTWNTGSISPPPPVSDRDMHHGTGVTHVLWCMPGSLTSVFLWSRWWWKRCRRLRNPQFYESGKRRIGKQASLLPLLAHFVDEPKRCDISIMAIHKSCALVQYSIDHPSHAPWWKWRNYAPHGNCRVGRWGTHWTSLIADCLPIAWCFL